MIIVAITGASGVIYGVELLKALKELDIETGLLISDPAKIVIEYELEQDLNEIKSLASHCFEANEIDSSVNSGSFKFDSMVIVPCSMKTLSAIANAYASNAITRVADVALKERRNLVIVPRETPLRTAHLENMARMKLNQLILWNDFAPINKKDFTDCAHSFGISVMWGYAWGWSLDCGVLGESVSC